MNHRSKKILSYILSVAVIAGAAIWIGGKFIRLGDVEFTDNAQVQQQIVPVNSRVQGYIKEIRFKEYQPVKRGDTLVIIDDADMRLRVAQANADYQNALAGKGVADRSINVASSNVAVSDASISEAKVLLAHAEKELNRYSALLEKDAVTRQQYDAVKTDYEAKKARYEMLMRQKSASTTVVAETKVTFPEKC
jgi:membrane fusion protein (multidrug efflux system)